MVQKLNYRDYPFLNYLFGTYKEIEGIDTLERHLSKMKTNTQNKEWLLVRRNILDASRFTTKALDEYTQAKEDVENHNSKFDWEYHGTITYNLTSIPLAVLAPYIGIPLLIDSTIRTSRMAFRHDPPVGLVGTVREAYQHLTKKK